MLRAAKTAVQALIAEISPWILEPTVSEQTKSKEVKHSRWITSAEICASAHNLVTGVVHNDGTISGEGTGPTLLV
jgi:hypothetical protein